MRIKKERNKERNREWQYLGFTQNTYKEVYHIVHVAQNNLVCKR